MAVEVREVFQVNREHSTVSLVNMLEGEKGQIQDVPSEPLLATLGFRKGKQVTVTAKGICQGPLFCNIDGRNIAISKNIADKIVVTCQ